jgi:hypothetical protein
VVLLIGLLVPAAAVAAGGAFVDDDTSVFEADIEWLADAGVTKGCNPPTNDRFCPNENVTRGQMAAFMRRFAQFLGAEDGVVDDADSAAIAGYAYGADEANHAFTSGLAFDAELLDGLDSSGLVQAYGLKESQTLALEAGASVDIMELGIDPPGDGLLYVTASITYYPGDFPNETVVGIRLCTDLGCGGGNNGGEVGGAFDEFPTFGQAVTTAVLPVTDDPDTVRLRAAANPADAAVDSRTLSALFVPFGFAVEYDLSGDCVTHQPGQVGS